MFAPFMQDLRSPCLTSKIIDHPSFLRPKESPAVPRWVRGCVEGYVLPPGGRNQGLEAISV